MEDKEPIIEKVLDADNLETYWQKSYYWLDQNIFIFDNLTQLIILVIGLGLAFYVSKVFYKYVEKKQSEGKLRRAKSIAYDVASKAVLPLVLILWISIFIGIYHFSIEPYAILKPALSLAIAWLVIRLGSSLIANPIISKTAAGIVWVIAALNILGLFNSTITYLEKIKFGKNESEINAYDIIISLFSIALFLWVAFLIIGVIDKRINASKNLSLAAKALSTKVIKFSLIALAILFGISSVGIDLTAFAIFGGAIGVGIGFGLQKIFSNLIAGFILLIDKSIKPGDTINVAGEYGKVETLGARYVSIITRDAIEHLVPNEEMIINRVENWSYSQDNLRLRIPVGIHYKSDVNKAIELCIEAAAEVPRVMTLPKTVCLLKGFGDSSVDLEIRIWIRDPMNGCSNVKSQVLLGVWERFHKHGIEIPYPQRDLHLRSVDEQTTANLLRSQQ